jgi:hypothetical protein
VVFSTVSPDQAAWAARELERTWSDIGRLADQWTEVHRKATFGIGAVGVTITNKKGMVRPWAEPAPGPTKTTDGANIFVDLSGEGETLQHRLPQLRRESFLAFLRVAQQDCAIPDWVQVGLAEYVSGLPPPSTSLTRLQSPRPATGNPTGLWAQRVVADRMAPLTEDRAAAALWVRYLLEGNDAQNAPEFFASLATTVGQQRQDPYSPNPGVGAMARFRTAGRPTGHGPLDGLVAQASAGGGPDAWLANREVGQPIIRPLPPDLKLEPLHREMTWLLKLVRRFPAVESSEIRPRVVARGVDRSDALLAPRPGPQPLDLLALQRRLTNPAQRPWATLDPDGRLLLSSDRQQLGTLLAGIDRRYRTSIRDGHGMLEATQSDGSVVEAWLEENPDNPRRPVVYVKSKSYNPPRPNVVPSTTGGPKSNAIEPPPPSSTDAGKPTPGRSDRPGDDPRGSGKVTSPSGRPAS